MRCELAERELSARLDGEEGRRPALQEHLATCPRCRAFDAGSRRLRVAARIEPAAHVPDLVPAIMALVDREGARPGVAGRVARIRARAPAVPRPAWGRLAAAFVSGAVAAVLLLGGLPAIRQRPEVALAVEIPGRIAQASRQVTAYQATFRIVERNFHRRVPVRRFTASVTFRAPEAFRAEVRDLTEYPEAGWPRNDIVLAVDADRWLVDGPRTCPREALPICALAGRERRAIRGREPFDAATPPPTDIVLPVRTLAGSDRVRLAGRDAVLGRPVQVVELPYRDARPLFSYLQAAGVWRPFFAHDRVLVSLDAETWVPLAYEVRPAPSSERALWAIREGLFADERDTPVLRVEATSFSEELPPGWEPGARAGPARDAGFRDLPVPLAAEQEVLVPADLAGLSPHRAGTYGRRGAADEVLLSFARGLSWLKIRETRRWPEPALFGDLGPLAVPVRLSGGGVAYYEPATASLGRRLSIHAPGWDLYLETNLPRGELLRVADSLPVTGRPVPDSWRTRRLPGGGSLRLLPVDAAAAEAPFVLLPASLPSGFRPWTAEVLEDPGGIAVTVYFRRLGTELDGLGIRLYQTPGRALAPPMDPDVLGVRVRGTLGRYSPSRGELEWIEDGVYRSLGGTALDLPGLLRVAASLEAS